jgi:hypothetical protein
MTRLWQTHILFDMFSHSQQCSIPGQYVSLTVLRNIFSKGRLMKTTLELSRFCLFFFSLIFFTIVSWYMAQTKISFMFPAQYMLGWKLDLQLL